MESGPQVSSFLGPFSPLIVPLDFLFFHISADHIQFDIVQLKSTDRDSVAALDALGDVIEQQ